VTGACDERSPERGEEKEEPKEPPPDDCKLRILGGRSVLARLAGEIKEAFYEYNTLISNTGYYLKPVHKVYKRLSDRRRRIYEYYGRYWWRRKGNRLVYAGTVKPRRVPVEPPKHPLDGLSIIVEDDDIIISCSDYEKYKEYFEGLPVEPWY